MDGWHTGHSGPDSADSRKEHIEDEGPDRMRVVRAATAALSPTQEGPTGGDTLTKTSFIQRVNTAGGLAPSDGCSRLEDVGAKAFQPYTADYFFYTNDDQ